MFNAAYFGYNSYVACFLPKRISQVSVLSALTKSCTKRIWLNRYRISWIIDDIDLDNISCLLQ